MVIIDAYLAYDIIAEIFLSYLDFIQNNVAILVGYLVELFRDRLDLNYLNT